MASAKKGKCPVCGQKKPVNYKRGPVNLWSSYSMERHALRGEDDNWFFCAGGEEGGRTPGPSLELRRRRHSQSGEKK